ncbi:transcription antitermination factor NusB [Winkia sp. UMB3158]|uniref:Ribosomal RNA small subunit methyltransferase B n=2 Tax=Bacillati TaxID=1783272 RepID=K0ZK07_9ACTO|nr:MULTISPECIES: transcription antitermination factor NusB [Winkia]MDK8340814.1 transcription antitermination factor NusB [Winkia sp. UMB3164B]EJZ88090.1 ribosomal RNA small subunit methyltransferase B [Winkia neuii BV029A5]MCG7301814.1 16S rRNA methyltransferase [Winkia sp. ACRQY]MDK6240888.1 transcription antitermination factor NusB [Winkia sp. UMB10116]MDK7149611.1 transcription antitermination factor NusB [Winkia sp. UMB3158]
MSYRAKAKRLDPAREAAFEVLCAVDERDAYANLLLPKVLSRKRVKGRDAAFATEITYGTLREMARLDAIISSASSRLVSKLGLPVRALLRIGAYQLLYMRVPAHAAVAETVDQARVHTSDGPAKLVNAALRRVSERDNEEWDNRITQGKSEQQALAICSSHPEWIVGAIAEAAKAAGRADALADILYADNESPYVTLCARPGLIDRERLADIAEDELNTNVAFSDISPWAVILQHGDPALLEPIQRGYAAVQDAGSQLVAGLLAEAPLGGTDDRWLDMCAGPGGKAGLLGALAAQRGARLLANEITPHRAELVRQNVQSLNNVQVQVADALDLEGEGFDRILLDAPCTGLGSLRRRPEARYRKSNSDLAKLTGLQRKLLRKGLEMLRGGGVLCYATCSPHVWETRLVIAEVLADRSDIEIIDAAQVAKDISGVELGNGPMLQLWPDRDETDAMFAALLRKKG